MGTSRVTKMKFLTLLRTKNIVCFTSDDVRKIFEIKSENTLKHLLVRLRQEGIIEKLTRGKYLFLHGKRGTSDFEIANFLVIPSYISLETALSFYGLLEQFPYKITSVTPLKPREIKIRGKIFSYSQIKKDYFKDLVKINNFLIASKEKALFDYAYFFYKGLRTASALKDLNFTHLEKKKARKYLLNNAEGKFLSFLKKNVKL